MTEKLEFYRCNICGNFVEIVLPGAGELVCCGQNMEKLESKQSESDESLNEKHVPVIIHNEDGVEIRVGSVLHPMEDNHYIQFIEVNSPDNKFVKREYFMPHEEPILKYKCNCPEVIAREYCNIHGLYGSKG